jgi:hypothetical protein
VKRYFEKYADVYLEAYLLGIEFSKTKGNIVGFGLEKIKI